MQSNSPERSNGYDRKVWLVLCATGILALTSELFLGPDANNALAKTSGSADRHFLLFSFSCANFGWLIFSLSFLGEKLNRWQVVGRAFTFGFYSLGFQFFALASEAGPDRQDLAGSILFLAGLLINGYGYWRKTAWDLRTMDRRRSFYRGKRVQLLGNVVWLTGYACVTHARSSFVIPATVFLFVCIVAIPRIRNRLNYQSSVHESGQIFRP